MNRQLSRLLDMRSERVNGVFMIALAVLLLIRPSASALTSLQAAYGISLTIPVYTAFLAVCGAAFLLMPVKHIPFWLHSLLTLPIIVYTGCLFWVFCVDPKIGAIGWMFGLYIWIDMLFKYDVRKEIEDEEIPSSPTPDAGAGAASKGTGDNAGTG